MKRSVVFAFLCGACGSSVKPQLTSITPATAAACPAGGSTIVIASDKNGNGKIDPGEATTTQNVCNTPIPPPVPQSLATSTPIMAGQQGCPLGGVEIDTGVDNGSGGGTANNGVLEAGEVTKKQVVCGTPGIVRQGDLAGPGKPAGASAITATGGNTSAVVVTTLGGTGGSLSVTGSGTLGGSTAIFKTGVAVPVLTAPKVTPNYGAGVQADFTKDASITIGEVSGYFLENADNNRLLFKSGATVSVVTGVHIEAGILVDFPTGGTLALDNDLFNEGSITTETGILSIGCDNYIGANGSSVTSTALPPAPGPDGPIPSLTLNATGVFFKGSGTISASGSIGNPAGNVTLFGSTFYNAGAITAEGGGDNLTAKLDGGQIEISAVSIANSGDINASAGNSGASAAGGTGGKIQITSLADLSNSGNITSTGGDGLAGGGGGNITLGTGSSGVFGGDLTSSGNLTTNAGQSKTTNAGATAGNITISTSGIGNKNSSGESKGSLTLSGNLSANGGGSDTGVGGGGGTILIDTVITGGFDGQQLLLLGYTTVTLTGGSGPTGGAGGTFVLQAQRTTGDLSLPGSSGVPFQTGFSGPAGAAVNEADIDVSAGTWSAATPGAAPGGSAMLVAGNQEPLSSDAANAIVINRGAITNATTSPPASGISFLGNDGNENDGAITSNTGDTSGVTVSFISAGACTNSGAIDLSSSINAAAGGAVNFICGTVKNTVAITTDGAAGVTTDGGNGGAISMFSLNGASSNTGALTAAGGTTAAVGHYPGLSGAITIDDASQ